MIQIVKDKTLIITYHNLKWLKIPKNKVNKKPNKI